VRNGGLDMIGTERNRIKFPLSISGLLDSCWSLVMQSAWKLM